MRTCISCGKPAFLQCGDCFHEHIMSTDHGRNLYNSMINVENNAITQYHKHVITPKKLYIKHVYKDKETGEIRYLIDIDTSLSYVKFKGQKWKKWVNILNPVGGMVKIKEIKIYKLPKLGK